MWRNCTDPSPTLHTSISGILGNFRTRTLEIIGPYAPKGPETHICWKSQAFQDFRFSKRKMKLSCSSRKTWTFSFVFFGSQSTSMPEISGLFAQNAGSLGISSVHDTQRYLKCGDFEVMEHNHVGNFGIFRFMKLKTVGNLSLKFMARKC